MSVDHYENFPVASVLCPPHLRPAVAAIYWFARTADDLADEGDARAAQRLADLDAYELDLERIVSGQPPSARWSAVFDRLGAALQSHRLPPALLCDLLSAFRQDVTTHEYADRAALLDYCRRSANPIGRLMLHLHGIADEPSVARSDAICTALQLANLWQDLSIDTRRGRLYAPVSDRNRHGVSAQSMRQGEENDGTRALVAELVAWTRALMHEGHGLVHRVPGRAGWELRVVVQGGLRILEKIEHLEFAVLNQRPRLRRYDLPLLLVRAALMRPPHAALASRAT